MRRRDVRGGNTVGEFEFAVGSDDKIGVSRKGDGRQFEDDAVGGDECPFGPFPDESIDFLADCRVLQRGVSANGSGRVPGGPPSPGLRPN